MAINIKDSDLIKASEIRTKLNVEKELLLRLTKSYYNQASTSTYISEDSIIECAERCKQAKQEYKAICEVLHAV